MSRLVKSLKILKDKINDPPLNWDSENVSWWLEELIDVLIADAEANTE